MTRLLNQIEREWFSSKVPGTTAQKPLGQLKREYYISDVGATSSGTTLAELETTWLIKYINNKGGTPTGRLGNLWKDVVAAIGLVPSKYVNENKILFFLNAVTESPSQSPSSSASSSMSASLSPSASASPSA